MESQPKIEPGSPPGFDSNGHRNMNDEIMSISEIVSAMRAGVDRYEEALLARDTKHKAEIGPLQEKFELERLMRLQAEQELKRAQESYEALLKKVKENGFCDVEGMRNKNPDLKRKRVDDNDSSNVVAELRIRVAELENEKLQLENEKLELEFANTKNLETIENLRTKLARKNINADAEPLRNEGVSVCGNTEKEPQAILQRDTGHSLAASDKTVQNNLYRHDNEGHIAGKLNVQPRRIVRARASGELGPPDDRLRPYLERAGFWEASQVQAIEHDGALVSAFVERWRPETHTFHLPMGECTITLQDVAFHLGLSIHGVPVSGCTGSWPQYIGVDIWDLCMELLGHVPHQRVQGQGTTILSRWLRDVVLPLPDHPTESDLLNSTRAYMLLMIAGLLMPDTSDARIHLRWLPLLRDLDECRRYSWGSAVLSTLYRGLCRATEHDCTNIFGSMTLLQSWIWFRVPRLRHGVDHGISFPLSRRWKGFYVPSEDKELRLIRIRALIDTLNYHEFVWMPYADQHIVDVTPIWLLEERALWTSVTSLLCFAFVEWHSVDRVLRQFGAQQPLPSVPLNIDGLHPRDARGKSPWWPTEYRSWYNLWDARHERLMPIVGLCSPVELPTWEYYKWYSNSARRFLSDEPSVWHFVDPLPLGSIACVPAVPVPPLPNHCPARRRRHGGGRGGGHGGGRGVDDGDGGDVGDDGDAGDYG